MKKIKNNNSGFTLLELTVSVSIFVVLLLTSTSIFKSVVESQRSALASQNIQESLRYAFEMMSREIRTARGDHSGSACDDSPDTFPPHDYKFKVYNTSETDGFDAGNILYFENLHGDCVTYATTTEGQLIVTRGLDPGFVLTPDEIQITKLSFFVIDDEGGEFHSVQPRVTIMMEAIIDSAKQSISKTMKMQTTVSSRYYE